MFDGAATSSAAFDLVRAIGWDVVRFGLFGGDIATKATDTESDLSSFSFVSDRGPRASKQSDRWFGSPQPLAEMPGHCAVK